MIKIQINHHMQNSCFDTLDKIGKRWLCNYHHSNKLVLGLLNFFIPVYAGNGIIHLNQNICVPPTYSSDSNRGNHGIYNISMLHGTYNKLVVSLNNPCFVHSQWSFTRSEAFSKLLWWRVKSTKQLQQCACRLLTPKNYRFWITNC